MYPVLFEFNGFQITSFGVLVAAGALFGLWLFRRELAHSRLPDGAVDAAIAGVMAGLAGAKLFWVFEHLGEDRFWALLTSRGGLTWYGGLIAGIGAAVIYIVARGYPLVPVLSAATPALAAGHLIGRIGCFLVGDDYGKPSDLPWAVAFPQGLPPTYERVHPTQLYEAVFLAVLVPVLLRWRRKGIADGVVLGRYLVLTAIARFLIEFIRVNERLALDLTAAQWSAAFIAAAGAWLMVRKEHTSSRTPARRARPNR